jgi:membrane-associated phospholipid phosphatase
MGEVSVPGVEPLDASPTPPPPERVAKASRGLVLGTGAAAVAVWMFIRLADEVMESETQRLDANVIQFFHDHATPSLTAIMAAVTFLAGGWCQGIFVAAVAMFLWSRKRVWPDAVSMLIAGFGGMIVDGALKQLFHRVRPEPAFYNLGYSFPSGHAFGAVAVYGLVAYFIAREVAPRWQVFTWVATILLILLIGFSRVYLRQHYPTDVLGGYLAGACWLYGCLAWMSILRRRTRRAAATAEEPG